MTMKEHTLVLGLGNPLRRDDGVGPRVVSKLMESGLPEGVNLVRVVVMLKIRAIENTTGAGINAIDGVQAVKVKKSTGTWGLNDVAAIYLPDNLWTLEAAAREAGDLVIGDMDVKSAVDGQGIYNFRLEDARVNFDYLRLNDVLIGLRFYFIAGEG